MPIITIDSLSHPGVDVFSLPTGHLLRSRGDACSGIISVESPKVIRVALAQCDGSGGSGLLGTESAALTGFINILPYRLCSSTFQTPLSLRCQGEPLREAGVCLAAVQVHRI